MSSNDSSNRSEWYTMGYSRGWNVASYADVPEIGTTMPRHIDWSGVGPIEDANDQCEAWEMLCFEAEQQGRDFSPFEFTACALNESEDPEGAWEDFEEGITDGIRAYWAQHHAEKEEE